MYRFDLFSLTLSGLGSLVLDRLAPLHVLRIHYCLAFDATVPIEMTSTTPLGRDTDLVGTGRVGAGLGSPVARGAKIMRRAENAVFSESNS